ncbi:MAG: hypothetical protein SFY32_06035 [Bacteroidota bacterium]|nr:hypothetical protein [Bacteroidota bacterium]
MKYIFLISLISLFGCEYINRKSEQASETKIARFENEYLYASDIESITKASGVDSLAIIDTYIDNWLKNKLLESIAKSDTTLNQSEIEMKVNAYRNSLIMNEYRNKIAAGGFDTIITEIQIRDYATSTGFSGEMLKNDSNLVQIKSLILQNRRARKIESFENELLNKALNERIIEKY